MATKKQRAWRKKFGRAVKACAKKKGKLARKKCLKQKLK